MIGSQALERHIQSLVGMDVRKNQRIDQLADFLIRIFPRRRFELRRVNYANDASLVGEQPGSERA